MSDYLAHKIETDFAIDGNLNKEIWKSANWSKPFVDMVTGERAEFLTRSALLWSEERLYIAFEAEEPDLQASRTDRDSLIFLENDLELFIDGIDAYYELEINALNTLYEVFFIWRDCFPNPERFPAEFFDIGKPGVFTFGGDYDRSGESFWSGTHTRGTRWAFRDFDMPGLLTAVHLRGTLNDPQSRDEGWSVEISIPWESLRHLAHGRDLLPQPASALRAHGVYDTHLPEEWSVISFVE